MPKQVDMRTRQVCSVGYESQDANVVSRQVSVETREHRQATFRVSVCTCLHLPEMGIATTPSQGSCHGGLDSFLSLLTTLDPELCFAFGSLEENTSHSASQNSVPCCFYCPIPVLFPEAAVIGASTSSLSQVVKTRTNNKPSEPF